MRFRNTATLGIGLAALCAWTFMGCNSSDWDAKRGRGYNDRGPSGYKDHNNKCKDDKKNDKPSPTPTPTPPPPPNGDCPDPGAPKVCEGFSVPTGFSDKTIGLTAFAAAAGSGVVVAGAGTLNGSADINLAVPGTSIVQALLYWNGEGQSAGDETIDVTVNAMTTSVTGDLIGGPEFFFTFNDGMSDIPVYVTTYRADITTLGLVALGNNTLTISGMDYVPFNIGAGLLVIYDDGTSNEIQLRDGQDLAFINFAAPLDAVVPQEFCFEPSAADRTASIGMFFGSVGENRPNLLRITDGDGNVTELLNELLSSDGDEWDTLVVDVSIPAGVSSLTIEAFSHDDGSGRLPASLTWIAAALTLEPPSCPDDGGEEGCTPGYWKQRHHFDSWIGYSPDDKFDDVFGVDAPGAEKLKDALMPGYSGNGGDCPSSNINHKDALGRHAVAALLNAASPDVDYAFSEAQIIQWVQEAYANCDFEDLKDKLEDENERGCPLN